MLRFQNKSQVAFEFVVLIAVLFTALIVFTVFVRDNFSAAQSDTDYFKLKDVALATKSELNLAITLDDGYRRSFFIPLTIDGLEYNITKEGNFLEFASSGAEYVVNVPPYTGTIEKGNNVIKKVDGVIKINV